MLTIPDGAIWCDCCGVNGSFFLDGGWHDWENEDDPDDTFVVCSACLDMLLNVTVS